MLKPEIIELTGKSEEEVLEKVITEHKVDEKRVKIEMTEEAKEGFLGFIGTQPAKFKVTIYPDRAEIAEEFVKEIIKSINEEAEIKIDVEDNKMSVYIEGQEVGNLIGKRGQTLNALQYLTNIVTNRYHGMDKLNVEVDVSGYKESRTRSLEELSMNLADKVLKTKRSIELEPMNSQERKVIHTTLKKKKSVYTYSKGEEPNRKVIISCAEKKEQGKRNNEKRPYKKRKTPENSKEE